MKKVILLSVLVFLFANCARSPIKNPDQAMRPASQLPDLRDDLEFQSLIRGLEANIAFLKSKPELSPNFKFGAVRIGKDEYLSALEHLLTEAKKDPSGELFKLSLKENFDAFEVYGSSQWGEVFITSYFEPIIKGSKTRTEVFTQPLYGPPTDMVTVDLESFVNVRPSLQALKGQILEQRSGANLLRGRLLKSSNASEPTRITAYLDRSQITNGLLKGLAPEIVWVDPIDAFFLEIQGSGVVQLEDGSEVRVSYAAQNGHPYVAIGKHLFDVIPREKMSIQAIEAHLRSLPRAEAQKIMNLNPSYVFFQKVAAAGFSYLGTEVVAGRTIATDHGYFPKGTLAFLEYDRPVFSSSEATEPSQWQKSARFVLDQDTGGAIRGPHRVDLFWGRGPEAKQSAGVIKNKGRLYYFVPKASLIQKLKTSF